ncbi:permease [Desulfosporosinus fructosivorans]
MILLPIPIYVITGFLDAGKTTALNNLLNQREARDRQLLVIQFESGEADFHSRYHNCDVLNFPKKALEQHSNQIAEQILSYLLDHTTNEIWIEWNSVTPFAQLQALLLHPSLYHLGRIEKVIHMADAKMLERLLGKTGVALPEQIANCDFVVVRNVRSDKDFNHFKRLIRSINPGVTIYETKQVKDIYSQVYRRRIRPLNAFCIGIFLFIAIYLIAVPVLELSQTPVNTIINVFLGIMLQSVPFLLIGVIISSIIQIFISKDALRRMFPKQLGWGMLVAILGGFCLPVCDCASIPIFKSLVRKGVPIPVAVTFMTATPVINPVVMLSTYYAFGGNLRIVATRVWLGIIAAVLIGLSFAIWPSRGKVLSGGLDGILCNCGCYEDSESITTLKGKLALFIRHSQAEFFDVGKYLLIGAFVSSVFQTMITKAFSIQSSADFAVSLLVMMGMAFLLSLCSSSDAVVARSFASKFPLESTMGFLVFGPMMDIKNILMLSSGFSKGFVGRLLVVTFTVCFLVVFLLVRLVIGG